MLQIVHYWQLLLCLPMAKTRHHRSQQILGRQKSRNSSSESFQVEKQPNGSIMNMVKKIYEIEDYTHHELKIVNNSPSLSFKTGAQKTDT